MSVCCPPPQALMHRDGTTAQLRLHRRLALSLASAVVSAQQRALRVAIVLSYLTQHPNGHCPPALLRQHLPWLARRQLLRLCIALLFDLVGLSSLVNVIRSLLSLRARKAKACDFKTPIDDQDAAGCG